MYIDFQDMKTNNTNVLSTILITGAIAEVNNGFSAGWISCNMGIFSSVAVHENSLDIYNEMIVIL